ncbi:MAG: phosphate ABC transporter substrate-binding protein [Methylomonas sp.]|jgi:phosphate transport system substrate-binding protein|uniref:phosphate ABC transporter substrate-binding protein n=1 Tax=Methylomonas sp. TaxID=418 RepID=UPI00260091A2|nr:phosphate ABC transporter substrate-binding protein [Methylomonas sp.]MCK9608056.1 phosphate ABC transporter substrate-binding protein [Methylomonas sp.]
MKKAISVAVLSLLILALGYFANRSNLSGSEAANPAASSTEKLVLTGSSTVAPLAAEIGKRFESRHPKVRIDVQTGGSSRGVNDARSGLADIGMASRALKPDEAELRGFTIALDGISIILNAANPLTTLDKQQIIDIFTGNITNWNELGGHDAPITVVNKAEGRSTLELFLHYFDLKNTDIKAQVVIGDNQQGIKTVAGNPDAIGYVSVGAAEYEAGHAVAIKLLPLDGIEASVENVRNSRFPLSRPLNLVTKTEPGGVAKAFIDFAGSAEVNDLIEAQYFVPVAH